MTPRAAPGRLAAVIVACASLGATVAGAVQLPANFVAESATPGVTFDNPTSIAFLPDGRMLVTEKRGHLYLVDHGVVQATPVWAATNEVLDQEDRGLLDVAIDPQFTTNHRIYLLYTADPDSDGVENSSSRGFGRLTRYEVTTGPVMQVVPSSRAILMGVDWPHGPLSASPSHTIGRLQFAPDGSLLVSAGDGASYTLTDDGGNHPNAFGAGRTDPAEDIGAFRAQDRGSLCGKILRVDPATGGGYPTNPWYDGNPMSVASRVWEYGLRNPFRFRIRPGTGSTNLLDGNPGTLYIGDVGYTLWEEISVATGSGRNFGWPCYEGFGQHSGYQAADPLHHGCETIGTPANPSLHTSPLMSWHHGDPSLSQPPGFRGNAIAGLEFYGGNRYPGVYHGALFFADYGREWMRVARVDGANALISVLDFGDAMDGPVDIASNPVDHDLYYVAINVGEVRRLRWTGPTGNQPPIASAGATPRVGVAPLAVAFSSAGTLDPDGDPIARSWSFGDATGSTAANPSHTYLMGGSYSAVLTVSDTAGGVARDTVDIIVLPDATFPTTPVLDNFNRANGPIGGSWVDETAGLNVTNQKLTQASGFASTVWSGQAFGPNQEAYIRFDAVTQTAPEHDLMLKVQGLQWETGHLEVRYDASAVPVPRIQINSYTPGIGWRGHGVITGVTFGIGDRLGARAYSNGVVEVYKNGVSVGTADVTVWPWYRLGGYLGMTIGLATASQLDDFGGGNVAITSNTAPTSVIEAPPDGMFYANGDTIHLKGHGDDAETPAASIAYDWRVDLLHNNHSHPSLAAPGPEASFVTEPHEDGTGVRYRISLRITDAGGLKDTTSITIWPEVDLSPTLETVGHPVSAGSRFPIRMRIRNRGRVMARTSHWAVVAPGVTLAQGDTIVAPLDSVTIDRVVTVQLPPGSHGLRAVADTLGEVVETDESNNASWAPLEVVGGSVAVDPRAPAALALSAPRPNPTGRGTSLELALPRSRRVRLSVHDVSGRLVWSEARDYAAGVWTLNWPGTDRNGALVSPGLYLAGVQVGQETLIRRVAVVR